jgi:hypothetical protein
VESHISRKTSEIWGTHGPLPGQRLKGTFVSLGLWDLKDEAVKIHAMM